MFLYIIFAAVSNKCYYLPKQQIVELPQFVQTPLLPVSAVQSFPPVLTVQTPFEARRENADCN